jgi:8-hydroxy-5-deazaflavin:NADPH oxidoreductase
MDAQRIALLGAGSVGTTLGAGFAKHGHSVVLASREPESAKLHAWVDKVGENACSANYADAVVDADWVFLCLPGEVAEETVRDLGPGALAGKIVVDVSNNMGTGKSGQLTLPLGLEDSAAQRIQAQTPEARVVKAFNSTGVQSMIDPKMECGPPMMPICGEDAQAKAELGELLREIGWDPMDLGGIAMVPILEAMTIAWYAYGRARGAYDHAYKFVMP